MTQHETPPDRHGRSAGAEREVVLDRDVARDGGAAWLEAAVRLVGAYDAGDGRSKRCQLDDGRWVVIAHVKRDADGSSVFVGELRPPDGMVAHVLDRTTIVLTEDAIHVY